MKELFNIPQGVMTHRLRTIIWKQDYLLFALCVRSSGL